MEGVADEDGVEEPVMLLEEKCEAPLVLEEAELCSAEFVDRPDWEDELEE